MSGSGLSAGNGGRDGVIDNIGAGNFRLEPLDFLVQKCLAHKLATRIPALLPGTQAAIFPCLLKSIRL